MKILIVDDEKIICEWLQFCIGQDTECQLIGCANNGEQALILLEQERPDIVFTDIRMPVMGGVELLKRIKEQDDSILVVLLTAFAEFGLAREALRFGGDDYLLKTEMNQQSFFEVLVRLKQRIDENKGKNEQRETEGTGWQHSITADLLRTGRYLEENDLKKLKECNIRWRDRDLFAVALWKKYLSSQFSFPPVSEIHHLAGFEYDNGVYVAVGNLARGLTEMKKNQILYDFSSRIVKDNGCMMGLSFLTAQVRHVNDVIDSAVCALGNGFYESKTKVYQGFSSPEQMRSERTGWEAYLREQRGKLHGLEGTAYLSLLKETSGRAKSQKAVPVQGLAAFCCDIMDAVTVRYTSEDSRLMNHMLAEEKNKVMSADNFADMLGCAEEYVANLSFTETFNERKLSKGVADAVDYLRKHYSEPVGLEDVADKVNLNMDYLSRIFKEETGWTYSTFLSDLRLKQAAYLLSHTNERVQKIAALVGYPNVSYFSTIFKKKYGVNPYEYRRGE